MESYLLSFICISMIKYASSYNIFYPSEKSQKLSAKIDFQPLNSNNKVVYIRLFKTSCTYKYIMPSKLCTLLC